MNLPLFGRVRGASFGTGAVVGGVAMMFARPILVGIVRAGYAVKDEASMLLNEAKASAEGIRAEAQANRGAHRAPANEAEVRRLREEIAALKASKR
jgi:hypothetical protein